MKTLLDLDSSSTTSSQNPTNSNTFKKKQQHQNQEIQQLQDDHPDCEEDNEDDKNGKTTTRSEQQALQQPPQQSYRIYNEITTELRVIEHYKNMRQYQTMDFYYKMKHKYSFEKNQYRCQMTIQEALMELDTFVDASDPDLTIPNKIHLLQVAEGIRQAGHPDWMQLVGLLHDMGKIMFLWGTSEDGQDGGRSYSTDSSSNSNNASNKNQLQYQQQWALGGDTFVLGCSIPNDINQIVFPQFNVLNPDMKNPMYNTKYGIYQPHCGLDSLILAWGHDEYMYQMLLANHTTIPQYGLDMIRYHSAYPIHTTHAYDHLLLLPQDEERLQYIRLFNQYDLYTKENHCYDPNEEEKIWSYYYTLMEKYGLGGKLKW